MGEDGMSSMEDMIKDKEDLLASIAEGRIKLEKLEETVARTKSQLDQFEKTVEALAAMIGSSKTRGPSPYDLRSQGKLRKKHGYL